jgi:uncharacterized membrane protein YqaE (UPF0057 family)
VNPLAVIAALFLPPLGVFLVRGLSGAFWLSVGLTLLGFLPGVAFALFTVLSTRGSPAAH